MTTSSRASWTRSRSSLEYGVEGVLSRLSEDPRAAGPGRSKAKVVVLGGGTGLSTVLGGNASLPSWPDRPPEGLLQEFSSVSVGVCTTDDGGSTGELVRRLPMIGIGDLRKVLLSMIDRRKLAGIYGAEAPALTVIQQVFLHRFGSRIPRHEDLCDPVRVLKPALRNSCPPALRKALCELTAGMDAAVEARLRVPGHCLGNLILTAAVFRGARTPDRAPSATAMDSGVKAVSAVIGVPPGRVVAANASPGALIYEYANGVVATGQSRAARARRGCAVRRVRISFAGEPKTHRGLLQRLRAADLIVYAPGSLYSSMLPLLLTPGIVEAIRSNRRAVKILGANLWIQEGETDMSFREESRGFWVSELIEAYGRNVPGGINGLFDIVLATSLDTVPGSIIRNYALEGKHPIHLDRSRVTLLGVMPVETSLFSNQQWQRVSMIHHDPARFAAAVRTVVEELAQTGRRPPRPGKIAPPRSLPGPRVLTGPSACARMEAVTAVMVAKAVHSARLARTLDEFLWENPDLKAEHLAYFDGVQVVPDSRWKRSRKWDNVLGYYDPDSRRIMLHAQALKKDATLKAQFAVALGESLLGRYVARKQWGDTAAGEGCRTYSIELRQPKERDCYLQDEQLRAYLRVAQMDPRAGRSLQFWRPVAKGSGFLPCGLLFGLAVAWYLDSAYVPALDLEMRMLQWPASRLLPYQVRARTRHRKLVRFIREEVLGSG
jgi:uncharacterized cofD-like protein